MLNVEIQTPIVLRPAWRSYLLCWLTCICVLPVFYMIWERYSSKLVITDDSVFMYCGIIFVTSTEVRRNDVRAVQIYQSLIDKILNIGEIKVGTAATEGYEIAIEGIPNPYIVSAFLKNS